MSKQEQKRAERRRTEKKANFLQNLSYQGPFNIPTTVELIRYNQQQLITKIIHSDQQMQDEIMSGSVSWFKVTGFSDVAYISNICKTFGIHRFDIRDLFSNLQVTKIVTYENVTFTMMTGCFIENGQLGTEQIAFILGKGYIISFQEAPSPIFDDVILAMKESRAQIREKGADYLLYILSNGIHSLFIDAIARINNELDDMEDRLIELELTDRSIMRFFRKKRTDYALIRRSIVPIREEFDNLLRNSNRIIDDDSIVYFNDFDDRLRTTLEELELLNESIGSLMDLYFNNNNLKMNDIIKRLTIVSTIFIPLTFMVGVWGMNFEIVPEFKWKYGYLFSWGVLISIAVIAILFLKKKKWL